MPQQDKAYLIGFAQLPDAASLDRTDAVIRRMSAIAKEIPGVESSIAFPGLSINGFTNAPNAGIVFTGLKPFSERNGKEQSAEAIAAEINKRMGAVEDAFVMVLPPPPVNGLGTTGGFKMMLEDRGNLGYDALYKAAQAMQAKAWADPALARGVLELPDQRAAAVRRRRPRQGQAARRAAADDLPDPASEPRLALRERLQPVRPHLPGAGAGRRPVPLAAASRSRSSRCAMPKAR